MQTYSGLPHSWRILHRHTAQQSASLHQRTHIQGASNQGREAIAPSISLSNYRWQPFKASALLVLLSVSGRTTPVIEPFRDNTVPFGAALRGLPSASPTMPGSAMRGIPFISDVIPCSQWQLSVKLGRSTQIVSKATGLEKNKGERRG